MGRKHYGHTHHSHHSHHHHHHHGGHDYMFGTQAEDFLNGGQANDIIYGLIGNDKLFGNDGDDWLIGGRGNDLLDGGPGQDKAFGGKGDDDFVYSAAENAANSACGPGDFYDGGKGHDTLHLVLTADEMADPDVQADIKAFEDFLANNHGGCGQHNGVFKFGSLALTVRGIEELVVDGDDAPPAGTNEAPQGNADTVETLEDVAVVIDVLANDTDADGDPLTAIIVNGPTHGTLLSNADGTFTYTPETNYNNNFPDGADGFSYVASDGTTESNPTNVVINITPVNDGPLLKPDKTLTLHFNERDPLQHIDVASLYDPGPADEGDQGLVSLYSVTPVDVPAGYFIGISPMDNTMLYIPPASVPPSGHIDFFSFEVENSLHETTSAVLQIITDDVL